MSTYVPIQAITITTTTTFVDFSNIPQNYTDLVLQCTGTVSASTAIEIRLGNNTVDSGSNYSRTYMYADSGGVSTFRNTNIDRTYDTFGTNTEVGISRLHFMNYSSSTRNKSILHTGRNTGLVNNTVSLWRSTSPINIIRISGTSGGNLNAGMTLTLYGIGTGSPKAFGGDQITTDGTYWYHTFRSSGVFDPVQTLNSVDCLVIAGGGSGGSWYGGGGGAGGMLTSTSNSYPANIPITVTVGAGGAGINNGSAGASGNNSVFSNITATGGGRGAWPGGAATVGGSGGGGTYNSQTGANGTVGQGNKGGNAASSDTSANGNAGAGGGGAGGAGVNRSDGTNLDNGSAGGSGQSSSLSGIAVTYAGGGGGGSGGYKPGTSSGGAGQAGGGNGAGQAGNGSPVSGSNATVNTGSGGGGASGGSGGAALASVFGGNGGSGIVIVRYPV